ncbi:DUF2244 domain-containing protein [Roseovarius pelagicus]|uniref:DUF2244 domain-containing protein n=1 Tax=Roseovarius pelagicus TaxID=2980108 RepID=A0ABY6DFT3_9RHOB|nr:DUF2244 domain-containing protein [Roseovarius pelagicus]UXX84910.1 DUF2244 domain-containing protein [Roseovarius pelagicus]
MPYEWSPQAIGSPLTRLDLWPHRSLPRRGFAGFMVVTCVMISLPLFALLGTVLLWGLLPFVALAVAGLWWALQRSYASGNTHEVLFMDADAVRLTRTNPHGDVQEWDCNSYWAQVNMYPTGGPVAHYLTLKGRGREVEIGAFLSEDERRALYPEIKNALQLARVAR